MGIWLVPRVGAIRMQAAGFAGMVAGMLVLAWVSGLPADEDRARPRRHSRLRPVQPRDEHAARIRLPSRCRRSCSPPRLRATAGGFAAACAKAGATLGTFFLPDLRAAYGTTIMLLALAAVSVAGCLLTILFRPTQRRLTTSNWNSPNIFWWRYLVNMVFAFHLPIAVPSPPLDYGGFWKSPMLRARV